MSNTNGPVEDEAIAWVIRLRDAQAEDWEAFTRWLEADPSHAVAYDVAALVDEEVGALPRTSSVVLPPSNTISPPARRFSGRRQFLGWGVAAAMIGVIGFNTLDRTDNRYAIETGAGERRTIQLADGSRIDLNGSTRVILDRENVRLASLEKGEALFTVRHDDAHPFEVEAGDALLRDMGTVFNVVRDENELRVGVAEGAVLFNPDREAVNLTPGMRLRKTSNQAASVDRREPEAIGGWREGLLSYSGASASEVAADLSRNLGVPVKAAAPVADRPLTGVIQLDGEPEHVFHRAASLLGVSARRTGEGWILTESGETS